jgi:hypothetical protein
MPVHPALIAFIVAEYQANAEAHAYNHRAARQACAAARLARTKIPSRLPWYWRWRYLSTRASFRRSYADRPGASAR